MRTEEFKFDIAFAGTEDIPRLVELGSMFYAESNFHKGLTLNTDNFRKLLEEYIGHQHVGAIIATVDGVIVGYCLVYSQTDFTTEPIGELYQFYVMKEYRSSGISRALAEEAVRLYDVWGCARAYAEASPGMADPNHIHLFENLWKKVGYFRIGVTMMKEFEHGGQKAAGPERRAEGSTSESGGESESS